MHLRAPVHFTTGSAGCKERIDYFDTEKPDWSAARLTDYGYTRLTVYNDTHLYWEQVSDDKVGSSSIGREGEAEAKKKRKKKKVKESTLSEKGK